MELDHVTPWAVGGETTVENVRLRCQAHNQHSARSYFGAEFVQAMIAQRAGGIAQELEAHNQAALSFAGGALSVNSAQMGVVLAHEDPLRA